MGLTEAIIKSRDKVCDPGYYCTAGAVTPHPTDGTKGNKCTEGHYCPSNSAAETKCAKGMYETRAGSDECQECPAGYYCPELGTTTPKPCEIGYCPKRSINPTLCPDGRYSDDKLTLMESEEDCVFCPEGEYCAAGVIAGQCEAGYFCDFGAVSAKDPSKICPKGHYCPAGTQLPIRCPDGYYYPKEGAEKVQNCRPC